MDELRSPPRNGRGKVRTGGDIELVTGVKSRDHPFEGAHIPEESALTKSKARCWSQITTAASVAQCVMLVLVLGAMTGAWGLLATFTSGLWSSKQPISSGASSVVSQLWKMSANSQFKPSSCRPYEVPGREVILTLDEALADIAELRPKVDNLEAETSSWREKYALWTEGGAEWNRMQDELKASTDEAARLEAANAARDAELEQERQRPPDPKQEQTTASSYLLAQMGEKYLNRAANEPEAKRVVNVPSTVKDPKTGKLRKILPEERAQRLCGKVWKEYAAFHNLATKDMRANGRTEPHRLAVFKKGRAMFGEGGGLGDTGSSHVTVLIFSMLTGRVFQEYWNHHDKVFYSPFINTTYTEKEEYLDLRPESEKNTRIASGDNRAASSASQVASAGETYQFMVGEEARASGDLNMGCFNHTVEIFDINKGITHLLWQNGPTAEAMTRLGLSHYTTYGCLSHFLMQPTAKTREAMQSLVDQMTDPDVFTISVHVRTDYTDHSLAYGGSEADNVTLFWAPFQCAQEVEKAYAEKGKKVIWYLATDSKTLRDNTKKVFGQDPKKRQVLFMPDPPHHISGGSGQRADGSDCAAYEWDCITPDFIPNLRSTFVDWYLLSLADFHVVTESGLGTTSAGRSMSYNTSFKVSNGQWPPLDQKPGEPICSNGPNDYIHLEATRGAFK